MLKLKVFVHPNGKLPTKGKEGDAGIDAYAALPEASSFLQGELAKIPLGISYAFWENGEVSHNYWLDVRNRSGVGTKSGFVTVAEVGDANYRGVLHYCAVKTTVGKYTVEPGDKIAQLLINPFVDPHKIEIVQVSSIEELGASSRGTNGFNSSGTK
jgi:dUTP pyrophosphatase